MRVSVYFFEAGDDFRAVKPYGFKYPPKRGPRSNMNRQPFDISVEDLRGRGTAFDLDRNGFEIFRIDPNIMSAEHCGDEARLRAYFRKLEDILKERLGATGVKAFRHGFRRRDPRWPRMEETTYLDDQPTTVAHIDASLDEARREIELQEGTGATELLQKRFQWFNLWKPLRGPLNDWPLLVCDAATVNKQQDITVSDLIYHDHVAENMQVYHRSTYQWYYLSDHDISEVIVFKQADSLPTSCAGVPHCPARNPFAPENEPPRHSIEVRALVYYD